MDCRLQVPDVVSIDSRGFSLVEVLFALGVLCVALVGLAHLFAVAAHATASARATTYAAVLARQKMEQLRSLSFGFDSTGRAITDVETDTTTEPERPAGGTGLQPSPADALYTNAFGYFDYVDANGWSLGGAAADVPAATVYIRRWTVQPLPSDPNSIVLRVRVIQARDRRAADRAPSAIRLPGEARMTTVRTRKAL